MDYELLNTPQLDSDYIPPTTTPSVPPDYLIQSGGGISNMHHGHPQGPYSVTAARSDIYGYSEPLQQSGFMQAVRGNMYSGTGLDKTIPRTCDNFAMNQLPPYATMPGANIDYPFAYGPQVVWGDPKKNDSLIQDDYTMIEPFVSTSTGSLADMAGIHSDEATKRHPIYILVLFFMIFFVLDLWIQSSNALITKYIFRSEKPSTKQLLIISGVSTAILFLFALWIGVPLIRFESA